MTPRQAVFTIALALAVLLLVLDLVRRRQLREEYSWLWVMAATATFLLVSWPGALKAITDLSGASKATTTIFMLAIAFLAVVCIHLCMKLTRTNEQTKQIAQKLAVLAARRPIEGGTPPQ